MSLENSDDDSKAGWLNNWENSKISDEELAQEVDDICATKQTPPHVDIPTTHPTRNPEDHFPRKLASAPYLPAHRPMDDFSLEQKKSIQELESHIAQNQADEEEPGYDQALSSIEQERYVNAWRMKQNDR